MTDVAVKKHCWCGAPVENNACSGSPCHGWDATKKTAVKKIYVAGPMTGYPDCNYPAFNQAAEDLRDLGYDVVNPAESTLVDAHYTDFLREDLRLVLDCDAIATLPGWEHSVGARNEVMVAGVLGMPVHELGYWRALRLF